jgi:hypothetical protein
MFETDSGTASSLVSHPDRNRFLPGRLRRGTSSSCRPCSHSNQCVSCVVINPQHTFDWLNYLAFIRSREALTSRACAQTTMNDVPPLIPLASAPFGHDVPGTLLPVGDVLPAELLEFFDTRRPTSEHATAPLSAVRNFRVPVNVNWPEFG